MARFFSFWRNLATRDRIERDLDEEMRVALELLVDEKTRAGMSPAEARRAAAIELRIESVKEQVREVRAGAFIDTLLQDVRYAARLLRRNPVFTLTAALSLAIGIGATTTVFTVANGLLLRSAVGVTAPDGLIDIVRRRASGEPGVDEISYPDYLEIRKRATTVDGVYAYQLALEEVSLRVDDSAERVFANLVQLFSGARCCRDVRPRVRRRRQRTTRGQPDRRPEPAFLAAPLRRRSLRGWPDRAPERTSGDHRRRRP
jgi:hypothetical protein